MTETSVPRWKTLKLLEISVLGLVAYLTNQTIFIWFYFYPALSGSPQSQVGLLAAIAAVILWRLRVEKGYRRYALAWLANWPVGLFLFLAFLSLAWTVSVPATLYRGMLALLVALIASYAGMRFSARDLVGLVACVVGVFALASLLLVVSFPQLAIHSEVPYAGLWRGIFWHKNYLGATLALGYVACLVILFSRQQDFSQLHKVAAAGMIALCTVLAVRSDSASGLAIMGVQTVLFFLGFAWLSWGHLVSRRGYWLLACLGVLVFGLLATRMDLILALLNRSSSLTGRVPLWLYLFNTYIAQRPIFGYGFGAFWLQPGIMQTIQSVLGWLYAVRTSDNGYMDVLLGLGLAGLLLLVAVLASGAWRSVRSAFRSRALVAFFPLFVIIHVLLVNITLSYFFEEETFIWFLLVAVLFMNLRMHGEEMPAA